ncbi:MFS transporter [Halorubrum vacuolatum]|uniref:Sugar phosphate permease n=1 Tax=Halorubrum vacuolatum TaxID=63740 RepID=A0A238VVV5_HALVU|nr:MFS transporter [Halorubrum vacuolatum]SNR38321.1 Sugar phosphate permease [Halorubrum vacuolatum]
MLNTGTRRYLSASTLFLRYLSAFGSELKHLGSDGRGSLLLAIGAGWGLTTGARTIYPVLLPHLRASYGLTLTGAGALLTVLFATYALGQLPGGILADRIGERKTLTLSLGVSSVALLFVVLSRSSPVLFVLTALFGFGVGLYAIARFTAIATLYPERYGTAIGVTNAAPEVGQAVLPPVAGVVAAAVGWQFGFGFAIPLFLIIAVVLWTSLPAHTAGERGAVDTFSSETLRVLRSELRKPPVVLATLLMILGISVWQAFTGFYPTYLTEEKGLSSPVASVLFGLYFGATAFVHPLSGAIYDRLGVRFTYAVVGLSVPALVALTVVENVWLLVVISILLGTLLGFETSTESYLVRTLPSSVEGTGFGILRTTIFAVGATSPIVFGAAADRDFFDEMFLLLAAILFVMVVLATRLPVATD